VTSTQQKQEVYLKVTTDHTRVELLPFLASPRRGLLRRFEQNLTRAQHYANVANMLHTQNQHAIGYSIKLKLKNNIYMVLTGY